MPSLIAMHWGAGMVPAELEGESFVPLLQVDHATSPGKQRVFSQYPHGLEYARSRKPVLLAPQTIQQLQNHRRMAL